MRVLTPSISWHNRERVSSVDFQPRPQAQGSPDGESFLRVATGGDDHHVVIWSLTLDDDTTQLLPHCLCDLNRHQNSVNVVRWSKDGNILASGDTDSAIILWTKQDGDAPPDIFDDDNAGPSTDAPNGPSEYWTTLRMLRGHLQDVTGLEFSASGDRLISCSIDNTAIVFDVNKGTKLKILSEHKGWVNGVAYDPLSKAVLTLASDRFLRVYNAKNFKVTQRTNKCKLLVPPATEERSTRLFHDDTFKSFYRRMSFSPDGELLVVPSGVLDVEGEADTPHVTYLFARNDWTKPVLYLPNKEYSVATRFSPIKYKLRNVPTSEGSSETEDDDASKKPWTRTRTLFALPYRMVYAVATQNTVMLYDTQQAEPFARVSKIHYIGLTDLTWSSDGKTLLVSSTDGFCSLVTFKEGELGEVYLEDAENVAVSNVNSTSSTEASSNEAPKGGKEAAAVSILTVKKKPAQQAKDEGEKKKNVPEATTIAVKKKKPEEVAVSTIAVKKKPASSSVDAKETAPMEVS